MRLWTKDEIKQLVLTAYEEGFNDGQDHETLSYKYPPMRLAWLKSIARKDAGYNELTAAQEATLNAWHKARYEDKPHLDLTGADK